MESKNQFRERFIQFFQNKKHFYSKSSSLIPSDEDGLLFTNAGMVPFKEYFSGEKAITYPNIVSYQKCLRTTDIQNIGHSNFHLSFFEMLGNFSFGDYFKQEAIKIAWEFLILHLGLDANLVKVSVHVTDDEAFNIWNKLIGIPKDRIMLLEEDNFWGPVEKTGVCGPSSEIYYKINNEFVEIWNIVFIQFFKNDLGHLENLKFKSIDTGMGLERFLMVLENKDSVYKTSAFMPFIKKLESLFPKQHYSNPKNKQAYHIIVDHVRAIYFLMQEGILPSNEGRGYVLRKLIRRALKSAFEIGITSTFLHQFEWDILNEFKTYYPELKENQNVVEMLKAEENQFLHTLAKAYEYLNFRIKKLKEEFIQVFPASEIFKLYDSFGLPFEFVQEEITKKGFEFKKEEFEKLMNEQRERGKISWKSTAKLRKINFKDFEYDLNHIQKTEYLEEKIFDSNFKAGILKIFVFNPTDKKYILVDKAKSPNEDYIFIFNKSIFYPEGGGQVADRGWIHKKSNSNKKNRVFIHDVQKKNQIQFHYAKLKYGEFSINDSVIMKVNIKRKKKIAKNHSATHLLHYYLIKKFNARQMGSLVKPNGLRFDFSYPKNLSEKDILKIELGVNRLIQKNDRTKINLTKRELAIQKGAIAFFKDKYEAHIRTVKVGNSYELCGGTHVQFSGEIGSFKIISHYSVSKGIRRIEAITGKTSVLHYFSTFQILNNISNLFQKNKNDILEYLTKFLKEKKHIEKENQEIKERLIFKVLEKDIENSKIDEEFSLLYYINMENKKNISLYRLISYLKGNYSKSLIFLFSNIGNNQFEYQIDLAKGFMKKYSFDIKNLEKHLIESFENLKCGKTPASMQGRLESDVSTLKSFLKLKLMNLLIS